MAIPGVGGIPSPTDAGTGIPKLPTANGATAPGTTPGTGATSGTGSTSGTGQNPMMTSMTDTGNTASGTTPGASGVPLPAVSGVGASAGAAPSAGSFGGAAGMAGAIGQATGQPGLGAAIQGAEGKVQNALQQAGSSTPSTAPGNTSTTTPTQTNQTAPAAENYQGTPLQAVGADPSQNLIGTQINPAQAPDLASANSQAYQSWVNEQNPVYQQDLREATQQAAATGSLGSGQLNTGLGSLADTFAQQAMAAQTSGNLSALQQDFANQNTNIGQMDQQQGYQQGLQQQGINNAQSQYLDQLQGQQEGVNIGNEEYGAGASTNPTNQLTNEGNTSANQANQTTAATGQNAAANAAASGIGAYAANKANSGTASSGGPVSNIPVTAPTTDYGSYGQVPAPTANTNIPEATGGSQVPYQGYIDPNNPYIGAIDPNQDQFASYGS